MSLVWFNKWWLKVNLIKIIAVMFNIKQTTNLQKLINNHQIGWTNKARFLEVTIDSQLNFTRLHQRNHYESYTHQISALSNSQSSPSPTKTKILIYQPYIISILIYGDPSWGPHNSSTSCNTLETVQNISLRIASASPWFVSNATIRYSNKLSIIQKTSLINSKNSIYQKHILFKLQANHLSRLYK